MRLAPCLLVWLVWPACHASPRPTSADTALAASIARVEHGLTDEIRVAGEPRGWSIEDRLRVHHTPAVSVAVIRDHRVLWARAWGQRDHERQLAADTRTVFQAASISKLVTALAALEEVEAGRVALDDDIDHALISWKLPASELTRGAPVTLRELLSHTAGVNLHTVNGYAEGSTLPTLHQLLDGKPPATNEPVRVAHRPGAFVYSGGGYLVVQQLIADLSGQPFATALDRAVLASLGLSSSTFELPMPARFGAHRARPFDVDYASMPALVNPESAPAGLWSTPSDLARLLVEIELAREGRSRLISKQVADWMLTPVAEVGQPGVPIGLGAFIEKHGASTYFGHDGWNDGFLSMARIIEGRGDGAVVMVNGAAGAPLIFEVMRSIAIEYGWDGWLPAPIEPAHLSAEAIARFAGRFRAAGAADGSITLEPRGGRVIARRVLREPLELVPVGEDALVCREDGSRYQLSMVNGAGVITRTLGDTREILVPVPRAEVEPSTRIGQGAPGVAVNAYRAALAEHPHAPELSERALDELGRELLDQRFHLVEGLAVFEVEAALYPESAGANAAYAFALMRARRRSEGVPYYDKARALRGHDGPRSDMERVYLDWRLQRFAAAL